MSFIIRNTLAVGAFAALAAAQGGPAPKLDAPCADAVMFMARGNNAPYQDWRTFPLVDATCAKFRAEGKTCDFIEIEFQAPLGGDYCGQVAEGSRNGISELIAFNKKCPCSHLIVSGYSEGAHIVGDMFAGPGGCNFVSEGLDNNTPAGKAIAAILLWGDALHVANQPYNVLDGADKQHNPRNPTELARLNRYENVLRSYCDAKDPVCAGGSDGTAHSTYFEKYTDDASSWIVNKVNKLGSTCSASSSSSVASSSSTATSKASSSVSTTGTATSSATATGTATSSATATGTATGTATSSATATGTATSSATATGTAAKSVGANIASVYPTLYPNVSGAPGAPGPSKTSPAAPAETTCAVAPFPKPMPYEEKCLLVVTVEYVHA